FWDILAVEFKRALRYGNPLSCLMIDIDLFKSINDLGTHAFGDYCLSEIGHMIRSPLRAMDLAARYGGEEFAVVLPSTDYSGAKTISEKIREKIESRLFKSKGFAMNLTVSIGVSSMPEDKADRYNNLVEIADQALYAAKMQGRNRVCLYRDIRLKDKEAKLGREKVAEIGFKLFNIMDGVKRDYIEATKNLIQSVEFKEKYRQNHSLRVSRLAARLAERLNLNQEQIDSITYAALLHDLGRVAISPKILSKKGKLTEEEYDLVKEHPAFGAQIIQPIRYLQEEFHCILHHHEWYNGSGYPQGLTGEDIPLGARILSLADAFDAMSSQRPYRQALSQDEIRNEFLASSGVQFDPNLTPIMLNMIEEEAFSNA
ncbi:diguanylate cyclase, partial [bacterium]|nr:diguanylate cyclase [bacterium]